MSDFRTNFLQQAMATFRKQKAQGDRALSQLDAAQLFAVLDPEMNSIAVIVKHLHGNMRSRWTDFLSTDGEKPDRQRDDEFVAPEEQAREQVIEWWSSGWGFVFDALQSLRPEDVESQVRIRGESISVASAIFRQVDHYAQHVGQIVFLAKHLRGSAWVTLSIPRGQSSVYNATLGHGADRKS